MPTKLSPLMARFRWLPVLGALPLMMALGAGAESRNQIGLVIVGGLIALERYGRRNAVTEFSSESPRLTPRTPFTGLRGWLAFTACALPALLGFVVPLLFIVFSIIARGGRFFIVAIVLNRYGAWIREVIEKRLGLWVAILAGGLVLGFIVAFRLF